MIHLKNKFMQTSIAHSMKNINFSSPSYSLLQSWKMKYDHFISPFLYSFAYLSLFICFMKKKINEKEYNYFLTGKVIGKLILPENPHA